MATAMGHLATLQRLQNDYENLLKQFLNIAKARVSAETLTALIKHYSREINSTRTSNYIKTLESLLRVLEKRDCLSYDNTAPLKYISSNYVHDPELAGLLENYDARMADRPRLPLVNIYELSSDDDESQENTASVNLSSSSVQRNCIRSPIFTATNPTVPLAQSLSNNETPERNDDLDAQIIRQIFLEISDKLGRHWRDVARHLDVKEYDIDEIDCQQLPLKEKTLKVLFKFQSTCDQAQCKLKLKRALEKARRRDLVEIVDELTSEKS